jgi:hypothetical protein
MTASANGPDVLSALLKFPPSYVSTFSLPLATIFLESTLTREQLLPAVGSGTRVGEWTVTFDARHDRLNYVRIKPLARPAAPPLRAVPPAPVAPRPFDPAVVGAKAREHMDSEYTKGNEITACEAVDHVLGRK